MDENAPDRLDVALGLAVRLHRHRNGMSQADLGEAIGVSFQQVQKYERGTNRISFSVLMRICEALGSTVAQLAAEVEQLGTVQRAEAALVQPEAPLLLEALSEIRSARSRQALVDLTRALAKHA